MDITVTTTVEMTGRNRRADGSTSHGETVATVSRSSEGNPRYLADIVAKLAADNAQQVAGTVDHLFGHLDNRTPARVILAPGNDLDDAWYRTPYDDTTVTHHDGTNLVDQPHPLAGVGLDLLHAARCAVDAFANERGSVVDDQATRNGLADAVVLALRQAGYLTR